MAQMIANAIRQAGTNFVDSLAVFLPRVVTTLAIIIVGWLIAMLLRTVVRCAGWMAADQRRQPNASGSRRC